LALAAEGTILPGMRLIVAFLAALVPAGPALAQHMPQGKPVETPEQAKGPRLDQLFSDLKRERNERAAERIANRIWNEWRRSGSSSVDLMMQWANKAVDAKKYDVALDFLDQVTTLRPDYAEGWNRRATVHYLMDDYAKAMADLDRALALEPRHFGALAGLAAIMKETGNKQRALEAFQRVLTVYPMMRAAQKEVSTLFDEIAGEEI
jgi:tetratricopeptide (TPR) repeat protein